MLDKLNLVTPIVDKRIIKPNSIPHSLDHHIRLLIAIGETGHMGIREGGCDIIDPIRCND